MTPATLRERNGRAILDAALDVLDADPRAGMGEIAARAGVGRATLYRHYASRDALVRAMQRRAHAAFGALLEALQASTEPPAAALERFVDDLLALREGYAGIASPSAAAGEAAARELWAPFAGQVRRWQADGVIDAELEPAWVIASLRGLLRAAVAEIETGWLARDAAPAAVVRALLHGAAR